MYAVVQSNNYKDNRRDTELEYQVKYSSYRRKNKEAKIMEQKLIDLAVYND